MTLVKWIFSVWIILFFLFLPFPLEFFPDFGTSLSRLFLPLTKIVSELPEETIQKTFTFSDSIHLYVQTIALLIVAIPVGFLCQNSKQKDRIQSYLTAGISLILGFFLLKYGIEKITRLQFPAPPGNILYTPLGQLDKDILFWSTMGTSSIYAWFMGIVEILTAFLLFNHRTRIIGALFSVGIFLNIFALNIGFDISVKLLSLALLSASLLLVAPFLKQFLRFSTGLKASPITPSRIEFKNNQLKRIVKGSIIAIILIECFVPAINRIEATGSHKLLGSYEVKVLEGNADHLVKGDLKRVHLHQDGHIIFESDAGEFVSHKGHQQSGNQSFSLNDGTKITISRQDHRWFFESHGNTELKLTCIKQENSVLPAMRDGFHWTIEGMMETN